MATTLKLRRGTDTQHSTFTGAEGEITFNTTTEVLHIHDGITAGGHPLAKADLTNAIVAGHLIPDTDVTYDLGSSSYKFRDIYLSGSTINLGGATISQDASSGTIALVAAPTDDVPNPTALVITSEGATVAVDTTGGEVDFDDVATEIASNPGFDGAYSSLTGTPTIPAALTDLGITDGTADQVLTTDGSGNFTFEDASGGGGASVTVSDTAPSSPSAGDLWWDSTSLTPFIYYSDGSSNQWVEFANPDSGGASFDGAFSSLTGTPTTISGYGITDAFDGAYSSLTGTPTIPTVDASSVTAAGALMDSEVTNLAQVKAFDSTDYATAAQGALADSALQSYTVTESDVTTHEAALTITESQISDLGTYLTTVAFSDLTGKPTTISGYGITDAFDGAYSSLTGTPTIPSALTDLGITDGTADQVLTTDGAGSFTFADASGGASVTVSDTAPSSPSAGDLWWDSTSLTPFIYYSDGTSDQWVEFANPDAGGLAEPSDGTVTSAKLSGDLVTPGALDVTGTVTADGLTVDGASVVRSGNTLTLNRTDNAIGGAMSYVAGTGFIFNDANGDGTSFNVGAANRVRIDSSGNVGIGTTSPAVPLHVAGQAYIDSYLSLRTTDDQANSWLLYTNTNDSLEFNYNGSGNAEVVVDNSGNVGIGTTSPSANLDVNGHINLTDGYELKWGGAGATIYGSNSNNELRLYTNNTQRMRVDSSGRLEHTSGRKVYAGDVLSTLLIREAFYRFTSFGNGSYVHLKTDIAWGVGTQMYSFNFTGHSYSSGEPIDCELVFYNYSPSGGPINIGSSGTHTCTVYESSDSKVVLRLTVATYYTSFSVTQIETAQGIDEIDITASIANSSATHYA